MLEGVLEYKFIQTFFRLLFFITNVVLVLVYYIFGHLKAGPVKHIVGGLVATQQRLGQDVNNFLVANALAGLHVEDFAQKFLETLWFSIIKRLLELAVKGILGKYERIEVIVFAGHQINQQSSQVDEVVPHLVLNE